MALLTDFASVVGIIISLILIILLTKSNNRGLDKSILVIIFSFILFSSIHTYATHNKLSILYYVSFLFDYTLLWTLGPLLFLYIKALFLDNDKFLRKNIIHFLPSFLFTIFVFVPKMIDPNFDDMMFMYLKLYQDNQLVFVIIRNIYFVVYLILSVKLFLSIKQRQNRKANFSIEEYRWINKLLFGSLTFASIDIAIRSFELFAYNLKFDGGYITLFAIVIFIVYLGCNGVSESRVLIPAFLLTKYKNVNFSPEEAVLLEQKIKIALEDEKLYLDETLSLKKLSELVHISDKKLSAFLNDHLNTKFKDHINFFRVEEMKKKLNSKDYDKLTLFAIACECGFSSKASFYRVFKKHTGFSPSEYKKGCRGDKFVP